MKRYSLKYLFAFLLAVAGLGACTNLEIEETDSFISEGFQGLENPSSALNQLYNQVYSEWTGQENTYALNVVTTDEQLIPTRGADWGDNGRWRKLHQHEWGLEEGDIIRPFDTWNANQLLASQILDERSGASPDVAAQARFLRAFSMYWILDLYGQVPFRDTQLSSTELPTVLTGAEAVNFILADLDAAISGLPATAAGATTLNRASKAAARYLKAKVLLNRHIFENQLTGGGGSPAAADMQEVINLVDAIENDGYDLQPGYFEIFEPEADTETILFADNGNTGNKIFNGLHYNSTGLQGGGWNGFSTLAEFYDLFEGDTDQNFYTTDLESAPDNNQEERRGGVPRVGVPYTGAPNTVNLDGYENGSNVGYGFLIDQQYALNGTPLNDRQGVPLKFTRDFVDGNGSPSLINNDEKTGIRVMKYNPRISEGQANHVLVMRYSDAYLMKAEAMLRSGGDPTTMVNDLRTLRGAQILGSAVTASDLLDERARELYVEQWRRNDMIRFGEYGRQWEFKSSEETNNDKRKLFPIPLPQLLANPNLQQNPGY